MRWILTNHVRQRLAEKKRIQLAIPQLAEMPWLGDRQADIPGGGDGGRQTAALDNRKINVLELRLFPGASATETAGILGLSKATVERELRLTRARLFRELRGTSE